MNVKRAYPYVEAVSLVRPSVIHQFKHFQGNFTVSPCILIH